MTRRFLLGRYPVSLAELIEVLVSRLAGRASAVPPAVENVVLLVRGPRVVAAAVAVGTIVLIALRWRLNVMSLPEDEARALGLATGPFRIAIVAAATLVTSASVATSGVIGWVGLVVRPFPGHSFTAWFRKHCDDAGLPKRCVVHGLRKAAGRKLAEAGCTAHEIMAILGHTSLREAERYTKDFNRAKLARSGMARLGNETVTRKAKN